MPNKVRSRKELHSKRAFSADRVVRELDLLRSRFDDDSRQKRISALEAITGGFTVSDLARRPERGLHLHESLLFAVAYPDDEAAARLAAAALQRVADAVASLAGPPAPRMQQRARLKLKNSGVGGADNVSAFSLDLCAWLVARLGDAVQVAWENGAAGEDLEGLLPIIAAAVDADGLLDESLTCEEWLRIARGGAPAGRGGESAPTRPSADRADIPRPAPVPRASDSDLDWLVQRFVSLSAPRLVCDRLWEGLDLPVRWTLDAPRSRSFLRFPRRPTFFQCEPLQRQADLPHLLASELPAPISLSASAVQELIDTARFSLAVRQRETDPVTYANPHEVTLFQLERGVDVALFGMTPERRLPIESYFGFVAARNRVPCAYGGGWVFFDQGEIGVNIFDTFRGGESAYLFAQILRVYARHYRLQRFAVDPYQFGRDNEEAIESGAYWFYYRLGFRSSEPAQAALAEAQAAKIAANRKHRTPPAVLRRLAESSLTLDVPRGTKRSTKVERQPDVSLARLSLAATRWIGENFAGDREAAQTWATERVCRALVVQPPLSPELNAGNPHLAAGAPQPWTAASWTAFSSLSPLLAMIPDLESWPALDRRAAASVLRAKGAARERDFALALQEHERLRRAWVDAAAGALER